MRSSREEDPVILSDAAIRNRVTVAVMVVLIAVAGIYSYITLPREAAPDVAVPYVLVTTTYEGVSPEDIENTVTREIEPQLSGIKGVKEISSVSAEGVSTIVVEFQPDIDIEDALQYVRQKVDQARGDLPTDADEPVIREINVAEFPIIYASISGDVSMKRLKDMADDLQDEMERVTGVLEVEILGALEREIRIEFDADALAAWSLTIPEVLELIPSENVNVSAGGLETTGTKFNVRVPAEFVEPRDVMELLIAVRDGRPIYLYDVARVDDTFKDRETYSRVDGRQSVTLAVRKRVGANIVDVAEEVKEIFFAAAEEAPDALEFVITDDRSDDIDRMVMDLENNIGAALLLVVLVLMLFMGFRTSLVVAVAIPLSMAMSFFVIQAIGYTLNMIVLFSLVLAVGMLVDNAIVIVENVYRHMQLGYGRIEAARRGASQVAWPVITSTATTVSAFIPLLFWPGIVGDFMKYLPATVIVVLCSSLFVALVVSPVVCTLVTGKVKRRERHHPILNGYRRLLTTALAHRAVVLTLAALLLVGLGLFYVKRGEGVEFFPTTDPRRAVINIRAPQGTHIDRTNELAERVERHVLKYLDHPQYGRELRHYITNVGSTGGPAVLLGGGGSGPHVANVTLVFLDYEDRPRPSSEIVHELREELTDFAGAEISISEEEMGPPTGAPVTVRLIGEDFDVLEDLSRRAERMIRDVPGLVNLRNDYEASRPEMVFEVDRRRAMLLGVNPRTIGNFLKMAVFGTKVGTYRELDDEYDITVRLPQRQRNKIDDLLRLRIPNVRGRPVPIGSLGEFKYRGGYGTIYRVDQDRVITLTADAEGRLSQDVLMDVQQRLADLDMPDGYRIQYAGEQEEREEAGAFLRRALIMALLLIVLVLVMEFNTLSVPAVIMITVVLSMIGVLTGLLVTSLPFGIMMTGIGVISLAGVVVNNAIVLLAYTRELQRQGHDVTSAAIEAGVTRLRPVMLTAITTIMGLVPMATGLHFKFHELRFATSSESSDWWQTMAVSVTFGMGFASLLTLVVVPTLYVTIYRVAARLGMGGLYHPGEDKEQVQAETAGEAGA
ncbi:MAG: efflux RND transporter permease subunit [Phycisphaerae bacterium]